MKKKNHINLANPENPVSDRGAVSEKYKQHNRHNRFFTEGTKERKEHTSNKMDTDLILKSF